MPKKSFITEMELEGNELGVAIGDVGAMLGQCAPLTNSKAKQKAALEE